MPNQIFVTACDGATGILDLDCQQGTVLSQILDCPAGWCCVELRIPSVDVGTGIKKYLHDFTLAAFGSVVQRGCANVISDTGKLRMLLEDFAYELALPRSHRCEQIVAEGQSDASMFSDN